MPILPEELLTESDLLPDGVSKINKGIKKANDALDEAAKPITTQKLASNSVSTAKIIDNSVTPEKVDFINKSENLFDQNNPGNQNGYLNNGILVPSNSYYTSHKINVKPGEKFIIRYAEKSFGAFYDINDKFLSKIGTDTSTSAPFTFTVPADADYMRVCGISSNKNTDMIVKGSSYPSVYIPFYFELSDKVKVALSNNSISTEKYKDKSVSIKKVDFIEQSINVFDKNSQENVRGYFLGYDSTPTVESSLFYSHHISVSAGEVYIVPRSGSISDTVNGIFYDKNGNRVTNVTGVSSDDKLYRKITVPPNPNIVSMRINYEIKKIDSFMIAKGETYPSQYVEFKLMLSEQIGLNKKQKEEIGNVNVLSGKILAINGDSIAAGAGYTGGYGLIIANRNGMVYENKAIGGGTITAETYNSGGTPRHWISRAISTMRADADYIILEGGVNDASVNVPFGTISSGYKATLDDTTFCGAFESMLKQAILKFQGKKIGFVIVHNIYGTDTPWQTQYYISIKKMCEKWGIPYCDLQISVPSLNLIDELKTKYTLNGDGWHPNEAGYKQFYVDKIESWMKTL